MEGERVTGSGKMTEALHRMHQESLLVLPHPLNRSVPWHLPSLPFQHLFGSSAQQACFSGPWSTAASVKLTESLPTLVVPELLSSRTRVLLSAMETCPGCPAVTTSERQPALAGEGRGGRGGGRGGEMGGEMEEE